MSFVCLAHEVSWAVSHNAQILLCANAHCITAGDLIANYAVLRALLKVCPHKTPTQGDLATGFRLLDEQSGFRLSGADAAKARLGWSKAEADKARALMAYLRRLRRRTGSVAARRTCHDKCSPFV